MPALFSAVVAPPFVRARGARRVLAQACLVPCVLITGPVRSGKSRFAERLARERGGEVVYVATARNDANDREWSDRIAHHAARRPTEWTSIETAADGAPSLEAIARDAREDQTLIVDSFGTWVAAQMFPGCDLATLEMQTQRAAHALTATRAHAIVVSEEVGWGIVPEFPAGRIFRDVLGRGQQLLSARAVNVYLVVAGIATDLRAIGQAVDS